MGGEVISNSGPLIHLSQIGKFKLLYVFSKIYIPKMVYREVNIKGKPGEIELKNAKNVQICEVFNEDIENIKERVKKFRLDKGELEAESVLIALYEVSKLFITKAIIKEAIEKLKSYPN